jgi:hypothetical protein
MTRAVDRILDFASLHAETCGDLLSVQLRFDGTTFHAGCRLCGDVLAVAMSVEDERAARALADSKTEFARAMRRAHRRVVQ